MTKKEAFEKIKSLLFSEEKKFENAKLVDGTIVQWEDELTEGTALNVVDADGNMMPAPDGAHEVDNGSIVTTVGGLVTKIEQKETELETEEEVETEMQKMFAEFVEQFKAFQSEFSAIKDKVTSYDEKFAALETKSKETESYFSEIKSVVEQLANEPATEIEPAKNVFKQSKKKHSALERIEAWKKSNN
jgi:prophage DNA circulation protein